ncbi:MAG: SAVED domain-containing protein [Actinomycetota bacterium]
MPCDLTRIAGPLDLLPCVGAFVTAHPKTSVWIVAGVFVGVLALAWAGRGLAIKFFGDRAYAEKKRTLQAERDHQAENKPPEPVPVEPINVWVRAFPPRSSDEEWADHSVSLLDYFDGRFIRDGAWWSAKVFPALDEAFRQIAARGRPVHLRLDAHASIAFACGRLLDLKSGLAVEVEQRMDGRVETWQPTVGRDARALPALTAVPKVVNEAAGARDVAVALSVTRSIGGHVETYVEGELPEVGRVLFLTPEGGAGQGMVMDGDHAARLADAIANEINDLRGTGAGRIHLFAACPNALMVALGRRSQTFGALRLYEFDFQQQRDGSYTPSLDFE